MKKALISLVVFLFSTQLFAHGEDKPGPHGGFIKMPGGYHTELVVNKDQSFHVFLLDMNFKNPTIRDSSVEATLTSKNQKIPFECSAMDRNHFHCKSEKKYTLGQGKLTLDVVREKAKATAVYDLPLKLTGSTDQKMDHSHH